MLSCVNCVLPASKIMPTCTASYGAVSCVIDGLKSIENALPGAPLARPLPVTLRWPVCVAADAIAAAQNRQMIAVMTFRMVKLLPFLCSLLYAGDNAGDRKTMVLPVSPPGA